jgi:hypothetical protein
MEAAIGVGPVFAAIFPRTSSPAARLRPILGAENAYGKPLLDLAAVAVLSGSGLVLDALLDVSWDAGGPPIPNDKRSGRCSANAAYAG